MSENTWPDLYETASESDDLVMPDQPLPFLDDLVDFFDAEDCDRVLEVACGEGRNSQRFVETVSDLYGCDLSEEALEICDERCGDAITTRHADVRDLPYDDGEFETTVMLDAVTHLREVELVLRELARVTESGGHVVFNMPVEGDDAAEIGRLTHDHGVIEEYRYDEFDEEVVYTFIGDMDAFETLLESYGLEVVASDEYEWRDPPHPPYRMQEHDHANVLVYARKSV